MSDNIPFDIQMEIIKKVYDVKSLIRFRSVSKPWKSFIDSSAFIKGYGARYTQPRSRILMYRADLATEAKHICFVDDYNNETFEVQKQEFAPSLVVSPLLKQYPALKVVGACHGLLCLSCYNKHKDTYRKMLVIWNPCIGKSFGIDVPEYDPYAGTRIVYGFGVCPVTRDPTVVKVLRAVNMPWHVEVFTLSSGVWNVIPSGNLPRQSITLNKLLTQVVIDRFIYWGAHDVTVDDDGNYTTSKMVVSFDLITKEFKVVDLPDSLTKELLMYTYVSVSKLRGSLVVSGYIWAKGAGDCGVWVREHDSSFTKLYSFGTLDSKLLGFRENGEAIFETRKEREMFSRTLDVYDPCSQRMKNLGISGKEGTFFIGSYKESLLLLDHSDLHIYSDDN